MEYKKRNDIENILLNDNSKIYLEELTEKKLSLRSHKISKIFQIKRKNILEQTKSSLDILDKFHQFQIYKFSTSFERIISYLNSSDDIKINYILNQLNAYFKYNEPDITEQKIIIEGQFLEILLNLGNNFLKNEKSEENIILIIWIFINIQIYKEGNGDYLKVLYSQKFLDFYNNCFIYSNSEEIMNEIILLLYHMIKINEEINEEINREILKSKVFESILNFSLNVDKDLELIESIIKLIISCFNITEEEELNENEINIIDKCLIILKNESEIDDDNILLLCFKGFYLLSKLNDRYKFNEKMITLKIPELILKTNKNKRQILLYALKTLSNILTVCDDDLDKINMKEILHYYNSILVKFDEDDKLVYIIFNGLYNITDSKYINLIKSCIIWKEEQIQKYLNMNEKIQMLFIKIIKYIINIGNNSSLNFVYETKVLEYLIYLISNSLWDKKILRKILKLIDNYLSRFNEEKKNDIEYAIIFNKFINWLNLFSDSINYEDDILDYIKEKYKPFYN